MLLLASLVGLSVSLLPSEKTNLIKKALIFLSKHSGLGSNIMPSCKWPIIRESENGLTIQPCNWTEYANNLNVYIMKLKRAGPGCSEAD